MTINVLITETATGGLASTASLPTSAPSVAVFPSVVEATAAVQAPAVSVSVAISVATLAATAAIQTPTPAVSVSVASVDATAAVQSPGVSVAVSAASLDATASAQTPIPSVSVGPATLDATAAAQSPSVSTGANATVTPQPITASATVQDPVSTVTIAPSVLEATAAAQAPTPASAVTASLLTATTSTQAPATSYDFATSPSVLAITAAVQSVTVSTSSGGWPDGFPQRRAGFQIDPDALSAALTDGARFPLVVRFPASVASAMTANGPSDGVGLRFADSSGTELPFQRVNHPSAAEAVYRVGITDPDPAATYYVYYDGDTTTEWQDTAATWDAFRAAWDFSEPPTGPLSSLNGDAAYDLTPGTGIQHVDGELYKAWQFDGSLGGLSRTADGTLDWFDDPVTIEVVGHYDALAANRRLFLNTGFGVGLWQLQNITLSTFRWQSTQRLGTDKATITSTGARAIEAQNDRYFVESINDQAASTIYLNGQSVATGSTFPATTVVNNWHMRIGEEVQATISEIRLSQAARSPEWISFTWENITQPDAALVWGSEEVNEVTPTVADLSVSAAARYDLEVSAVSRYNLEIPDTIEPRYTLTVSAAPRYDIMTTVTPDTDLTDTITPD